MSNLRQEFETRAANKSDGDDAINTRVNELMVKDRNNMDNIKELEEQVRSLKNQKNELQAEVKKVQGEAQIEK